MHFPHRHKFLIGVGKAQIAWSEHDGLDAALIEIAGI